MSRFPFSSRRSIALGAAVIATFTVSTAGRALADTLPRANIVLPNALAVNVSAQTVTLPLHRGRAGGNTVWYIVTDSSDKADAAKRGAIYAPLLANVGSGCSACVEHVSEREGEIAFAAAPDFAPARTFTPGPGGFPPQAASPGATATSAYSPFITIGSSTTVINAPIVATGDGDFDTVTHKNTHDRVVAIDVAKKTVTLLLVHGFANGKPVLYISTEASDPGVATIERATFVPSLAKATAGKIPIYVVANGPWTGAAATSQGLGFAALHGKLDEDATSANSSDLFASMNVVATFPTGSGAAAYTPLWDANLGFWTDAAIGAKHDVQLTTGAAFAAAADAKQLTGPGGKAFGSIGVVVNCPVVAYIGGAP
jgi:hypothetical protein